MCLSPRSAAGGNKTIPHHTGLEKEEPAGSCQEFLPDCAWNPPKDGDGCRVICPECQPGAKIPRDTIQGWAPTSQLTRNPTMAQCRSSLCKAIPAPRHSLAVTRGSLPREGHCHSQESLMKPPRPLWVSMAPLHSGVGISTAISGSGAAGEALGHRGEAFSCPATSLHPPALHYKPALSIWAIKNAGARWCCPLPPGK